MAFDLAAALRGLDDVSESGTGREQIEYIALEKISDDPGNFYSLDGIDELAANIELLGLQQPLRVRTDPEAADKVIIVSGHRRAAALRLLASDGKTAEPVACIRERGGDSPELTELRLIYANSDTRRMSPADISRQAERVEELLYKLKEQGMEFPGRMRDHVAEACRVSKSKLARLKVIRDNLREPHFLSGWCAGKLAESTAYVIAQQSRERQSMIYELYGSERDMQYVYESDVKRFVSNADRLEARTCKKCESRKCDNAAAILQKIHGTSDCSYKPCKYESNKCCADCGELANCRAACPQLADKVKKLKADKKAAARQMKQEQEAKDAPIVAMISSLAQRFSLARTGAGMSVAEAMTAMGRSYYGGDEAIIRLENLAEKITPNTVLSMYGWSTRLYDLSPLVKAADAFGCSVDYLLCRTDEKAGPGEVRSFKWQTGTPEKDGAYVGRFEVDGLDHELRQLCWYDRMCDVWRFGQGGASIDARCAGWIPLPEE